MATNSKKEDTVDKLTSYLRARSDFPALSKTVALINEKVSTEGDTSITELTNIILDDLALTNKLLKMVNTAIYAKFQVSGRINTVSRAIYLLGVKTVRNTAMAIFLLENIKSKTLQYEIRELFIISYMTALISKKLSAELDLKDREEAFICGMFHNLGLLLVKFYLTKESKEIDGLISREDISSDRASKKVLGFTYSEIGKLISKQWHFSDTAIYCMDRLPLDSIPKPVTNVDMIHRVILFSSLLCELVNSDNLKRNEWEKKLSEFMWRFESSFTIKEDSLLGIFDSALDELIVYVTNYNLNLEESTFIRKLFYLLRNTKIPDSLKGADDMRPTAHATDEAPAVKGIDSLIEGTEDDEKETPEEVMTRGIMDITDCLLNDDFSLNDALRMMLETMYRGIKFDNVIICIKNTKDNTMDCRFGFGRDIEEYAKSFRFKIDDKTMDLFNISLKDNSIILLKDLQDKRMKQHMPDWYVLLKDSGTMIVIPIVMNKNPIAMIYGDYVEPNVEISRKSLRILKTIQKQALLAIKQLTVGK